MFARHQWLLLEKHWSQIQFWHENNCASNQQIKCMSLPVAMNHCSLWGFVLGLTEAMVTDMDIKRDLSSTSSTIFWCPLCQLLPYYNLMHQVLASLWPSSHLFYSLTLHKCCASCSRSCHMLSLWVLLTIFLGIRSCLDIVFVVVS